MTTVCMARGELPGQSATQPRKSPSELPRRSAAALLPAPDPRITSSMSNSYTPPADDLMDAQKRSGAVFAQCAGKLGNAAL